MSALPLDSITISRVNLAQVLPLRQQVLWPNKPESFCLVDGDDSAEHYGASIDGQLVCVASIYNHDNRARLRKFATLPELQGQGIGKRVLSHIIDCLMEEGFEGFWCDARTSAIDFYRKFGLVVDSDEFDKSGVKYVKMSVSFRNNSG